MKSQCEIIFDEEALSRACIPVPGFPEQPYESIPREAELDAGDALEPIHDELKIQPLWWIVEFMPFFYTWQDANCVWHKTIRLV